MFWIDEINNQIRIGKTHLLPNRTAEKTKQKRKEKCNQNASTVHNMLTLCVSSVYFCEHNVHLTLVVARQQRAQHYI